MASIVGTAQIQAGGSSVDVPLSTTAVQSVTPVTFTATLAGVTRQAVLSVNPAASASLSSAALTAPSLTGGVGARLRITLTQNAPAGGLVVALTSGNQGVAAILPSVTIPAGSSTVEVPVTTTPVGTQTQVLLSATVGAVSRQATLTVNPPALSALAVSPTPVQGGTAASATVTLNGPAPADGFAVTLGSNNAAAATTPNSVPVPAGQSSVTFTVTTNVVISNTTVQLQASAQGRSVTASLYVTPQKAKIKGVSTKFRALTLDVTVTLDGPAGPAGALVSLSGSDNAVAGLSGRQLTIGPGATSAVAAFAVNPPPSGSVTLAVTATLDGLSQSASVLITGRMVVIKELRVPARPAANSWANAVVELSSAVTGSLSAPVVATTGVISQTQWLYPIAAGRSYLVLSFRSSTAGTGTISVSYGGVTKVATVTFQ